VRQLRVLTSRLTISATGLGPPSLVAPFRDAGRSPRRSCPDRCSPPSGGPRSFVRRSATRRSLWRRPAAPRRSVSSRGASWRRSPSSGVALPCHSLRAGRRYSATLISANLVSRSS